MKDEKTAPLVQDVYKTAHEWAQVTGALGGKTAAANMTKAERIVRAKLGAAAKARKAKARAKAGK